MSPITLDILSLSLFLVLLALFPSLLPSADSISLKDMEICANELRGVLNKVVAKRE